MITLSRRAALAALPVGLAAAWTPIGAPKAQSPRRGQVPGYYRVRVGDAVVTALLDGYIDVGAEFWVNVAPDAVRDARRRSFQSPDQPLRLSVNAYLIEHEGRVIAVDAGADALFGPTAGKYADLLDAAGYAPDRVDTLLFTHLHPDHIGGAIAGGRAAFPNAEAVVAEADHAFWTSASEQAAAPDFARPWFDAARTLADLYGDRLSLFSGEAAVAPGITAAPLPGHTPGHSGFVLESAGARLFFWGDVISFLGLQLADPRAALVFDVDKPRGERARRAAIDIAVSERLQIAGSHAPFPSFGHIARENGAARYLPSEWTHDI